MKSSEESVKNGRHCCSILSSEITFGVANVKKKSDEVVSLTFQRQKYLEYTWNLFKRERGQKKSR
jgi:hypothetical protein